MGGSKVLGGRCGCGCSSSSSSSIALSAPKETEATRSALGMAYTPLPIPVMQCVCLQDPHRPRKLRGDEGKSHRSLNDVMFAALLCPARLRHSSNR